MTLSQVKETIKELGLDRYHNPVRKEVTFASKKEMVEFAVEVIQEGLTYVGPHYRVNVFVIKNDGTFSIIFNDHRGISIGKSMTITFMAKFVKAGIDEDCVVIYETTTDKYAVVARD